MDWLIDTLNKAADAIAHFVAVVPMQFWAMLLGLLASILVTQRVKFWLPDLAEWLRFPEKYRRIAATLLTQSVAFWTALIVTACLWPGRAALIAGACIGIASPTLYAIFVRVVAMKWPDVRDTLSKDSP